MWGAGGKDVIICKWEEKEVKQCSTCHRWFLPIPTISEVFLFVHVYNNRCLAHHINIQSSIIIVSSIISLPSLVNNNKFFQCRLEQNVFSNKK